MKSYSNGENSFVVLERNEMAEERVVSHITTSYEEVVNRINYIQRYSNQYYPVFNHLVDAFYELLKRIPLPLIELDTDFIVRSRPGYQQNGKLFSEVSHLSYNPKVEEIPAGRFNIDCDPVFYAAVPSKMTKGCTSITSILETDKNIVDQENISINDRFVSVSKWTVQKKMFVVNLTLCPKAIENNLSIRKVNYFFLRQMVDWFTEPSSETMIYLFEYMSQKAAAKTNNVNDYLVTNAFKIAMERYYGPYMNGIIYPSSMTENDGVNVVLNKQVIDRGDITFDGMCVYKIQGHGFKKERSVFPCSNFIKADCYGNFKLKVNPDLTMFG